MNALVGTTSIFIPAGPKAIPKKAANKGGLVVLKEWLGDLCCKGYFIDERIGSYIIHGNKGLVGKDVFHRNIFSIAAPKSARGSIKNMKYLINSLEHEALDAGAKRISIYGFEIVNNNFFNPSIMQRFGYEVIIEENKAVLMIKILR